MRRRNVSDTMEVVLLSSDMSFEQVVHEERPNRPCGVERRRGRGGGEEEEGEGGDEEEERREMRRGGGRERGGDEEER